MGSNTNTEITAHPDAVSEYKVLASNYSSKYGQGAGAVILMVTKSGTKDFHGTSYDYVRNDILDAADFFQNASNVKKPPFRYNDFGYAIGGPVYIPGHYNKDKTKTFFYWDNEWLREYTATNLVASTPTAAMRGGDFSGLGPLKNPLNPQTGQPMVDGSGVPCVGGTGMTTINPNCINNNVSLLFQQDFSLPTTITSGNPAPGFSNYFDAAKSGELWSEQMLRVDQNITQNLRTFVRFIHDGSTDTEPISMWSSDSFPTVHSLFRYPSRNLIATFTSVITPRLLNEFHYQWASSYGSPTTRHGRK